jgi:hypothetical protein
MILADGLLNTPNGGFCVNRNRLFPIIPLIQSEQTEKEVMSRDQKFQWYWKTQDETEAHT